MIDEVVEEFLVRLWGEPLPADPLDVVPRRYKGSHMAHTDLELLFNLFFPTY